MHQTMKSAMLHASTACPLHAFTSQLPHTSRHRLQSPRSSPAEQQEQQTSSSSQSSSGGIQLNEDMLAQLRAAQEETAKLKKELEVLQQQKGSNDVIESKPMRIDSIDNRETPWSPSKRTAWLSEADVDFFTGGGATEAADEAGSSPEAQATIGKRLAIGGLITAGLLAFALVPTKDLRLKPNKPLYFYIIQLLQAQAQLTECAALIEGAQWDSLRIILPRIKGNPTNAESAVFDIVALLDADTAAKAEPLAADFLEYLDTLDYNKYFDAMPTKQITGIQNAEYVRFSNSALKAAQGKLAAFLALMPPSELKAAKQQVQSQETA